MAPFSPGRARQALPSKRQGRQAVVGDEIVARTLALSGITHICSIPGHPIDATLAAGIREGSRVIGTRQKRGATLMSAAHSNVSGALRSAVIDSSGPAVTNTATGILIAHDNRGPLLVIRGRRGLSAGEERGFLALDGAGLLEPITKHAAVASKTGIAQPQSLRRSADEANRKRCEAGDDPMPPFRWLNEVRERLPASAITVLDGNVVTAAAQLPSTVLEPVSRFTAASNGCMGVGAPFAIGAKLARPGRPVLATCGDFGFGLTAVELETAVRQQVPITVIVADNCGAGGGTWQQEFPPPNGDPVVRFTRGLQHGLFMEAFGGRGIRVQRPGGLGTALRGALASDSPTCNDVLTNEDIPLAAVI